MEQTTEQLEQAEQRQIVKQLEESIKLGKSLNELKASKHFKKVFMETFLDMGKNILWENIRHLKEEQLKGRGSDKNLEVLTLIEGQVKSRLDFEGFMDTVENDAINAMESLMEINAEAEGA